jgi:hypothetical protein
VFAMTVQRTPVCASCFQPPTLERAALLNFIGTKTRPVSASVVSFRYENLRVVCKVDQQTRANWKFRRFERPFSASLFTFIELKKVSRQCE